MLNEQKHPEKLIVTEIARKVFVQIANSNNTTQLKSKKLKLFTKRIRKDKNNLLSKRSKL